MSYLVIARKYRPSDFSTVSGQEQVTRTLSNSIARNKVAHAMLFCGPRGVGKTSVSRIFAKALNCENGPTPSPCGECTNCREISAGVSLAVREIDGASHNSVDNVRELIETLRSLPPPGSRYKVYIIDEVHMLSTAAFNALLKSLEEPPPNTVFILATTEVHKIPQTVLSRCQRHDFRVLHPSQIFDRLKTIAKSEELVFEDEALRMIARLADGSMRDAQTLLDRAVVFSSGKLTAGETAQILGTVQRSLLVDLARAILERDAGTALGHVDKAFSFGLDTATLLKDFAGFWRDLMLYKVGGVRVLEEQGLEAHALKELEELGAARDAVDLQDLAHLAQTGCDSALRSAFPRFSFDALTVRMATREPVRDVGQTIARLRQMVASGGGAATSGGGTPKPTPRASAPSAAAPAPATSAPVAQGVVTPAAPAPKSSAPVAPTPAAEPPPVEAAPQSDKVIDWIGFVKYGMESGNRFLGENLKRLSIDKFKAGQLEATAPRIAYDYLQKEENRSKLIASLEAFSGVKGWSVKFRLGEATGGLTAGSLVHEEHVQKQKSRDERTKQIQAHPTIQSLQKAFPGTTIDSINFEED